MSDPSELRNVEIVWTVGDIPVRATLTETADGNRRPAVVFVAGSGPTDRNWESPLIPGNNGSARLLATALAKAGFVTLRYDKRASGPDAQENAARLAGTVSLQSHLDELSGAVGALLARPNVSSDRLYVLTNSEGAIHALNYQQQAREYLFAGFVLTGVPGRSIKDTMRTQVVPQLRPLPNGESLIAQFDAAVADYVDGRPVRLDPEAPVGLQRLFQSLETPANLPFARELLNVDPAQMLKGVREPVLVVIGKKDLQVDWQVDGNLLQTALAGRTNVTYAYPENANHVLKYEPKPREELTPAEVGNGYNAADRVLDAETLDSIRAWLIREAAPVTESRAA